MSNTCVERSITRILPDSNCVVDNGNKLAAVSSNLIDMVGQVCVCLFRNSEHFVIIHVVNVRPHSVKGEIEGGVVLIHVPPDTVIHIPKLALVPSERPHGGHCLEACELLVLPYHVLNLVSLEYNLLDNTSDCNLSNLCSTLTINVSVDKVVRSICANIKYSDPLQFFGIHSLIIVYWLVTVHVLSRWLSVINGVWCIVWPYCVNCVMLVFKHGSSSSFTDSHYGSSSKIVCDECTSINDKIVGNHDSERI